ncbi:hypothetical protein MHU86_18427 [Fragilaria crotonensis]|nr:hypothetical protein MHU86_18427 [Fragilaria crotonensis]
MSLHIDTAIEASDNDDDDDEIRPKYRIDQRVFCKENKNMYEAVIRKTSFKDGKWTYLVHFAGWNTRWDRWVEDSELCEPTEELRKEAAATAQEGKQVKKVKQTDRKRKKRDGDVTPGKNVGKRHTKIPCWEEYCELPFTLKTVLIDEKDRIMRVSFRGPKAGVDSEFDPGHWRTARDVHNLPASVPIKSVLNFYVKMKRKEASTPEAATNAEESAKAFIKALADLFEEALPVCLLYHPERAQYLSICSNPTTKDLRKTEVYGCEYLLRLFVRLPVILKDSGDTTSRRETGQHIADLIILLQRNRSTCFKVKYREPRHDELNDYEKALMDHS